MSKLRKLLPSKKPADKPTDALTKELEAEPWDGRFTYTGYSDVVLHEHEYTLPTGTQTEIKPHPLFRLDIDSPGKPTALEIAARLAMVYQDQTGNPVTKYVRIEPDTKFEVHFWGVDRRQVDIYEKKLWPWDIENGTHPLMVSLSGEPEDYYPRGQENTPFELFVCTKDEIEFARLLPDDRVLGEGCAPRQRLGCWLPKGRLPFFPKQAVEEIVSKRSDGDGSERGRPRVK